MSGGHRSGVGGGQQHVHEPHHANVPGDDSRDRGGDLRGTPPRVKRERLETVVE